MIAISVKSKYGLTAIFELALQPEEKTLQIKTIAEKHGIPQNYLEQLLVELKKAGFVKSFRGSQGGYALAKPAYDIKVYEILECLEGPANLTEGHKGCAILSNFWQDVENKLKEAFDISLADLIRERQKIQKTLTYSI